MDRNSGRYVQQLYKSPLVFSQQLLLTQNLLNLERIFGIIFFITSGRSAFITIMSFPNIFNDSVNTQVIPFTNQLPFSRYQCNLFDHELD